MDIPRSTFITTKNESDIKDEIANWKSNILKMLGKSGYIQGDLVGGVVNSVYIQAVRNEKDFELYLNDENSNLKFSFVNNDGENACFSLLISKHQPEIWMMTVIFYPKDSDFQSGNALLCVSDKFAKIFFKNDHKAKDYFSMMDMSMIEIILKNKIKSIEISKLLIATLFKEDQTLNLDQIMALEKKLVSNKSDPETPRICCMPYGQKFIDDFIASVSKDNSLVENQIKGSSIFLDGIRCNDEEEIIYNLTGLKNLSVLIDDFKQGKLFAKDSKSSLCCTDQNQRKTIEDLFGSMTKKANLSSTFYSPYSLIDELEKNIQVKISNLTNEFKEKFPSEFQEYSGVKTLNA